MVPPSSWLHWERLREGRDSWLVRAGLKGQHQLGAGEVPEENSLLKRGGRMETRGI